MIINDLDKKLCFPLKELEEYAWELEEDIEEVKQRCCCS